MDTSNTLYTIRSDNHRRLFKLWYKERYGSVPRNVNTGNKKLLGCFMDCGKIVKIPLDKAFNNKYIDMFWNWMVLNNGYTGKIPKWKKQDKKPIKSLSSVDYNTYIKSPEWKIKSRLLIISRGGMCEVCCSKKNLHTHHYNYLFLGNERDKDLFCLCKQCHEWYHIAFPSNKLPTDNDLDIGNRLLHIINTIRQERNKN